MAFVSAAAAAAAAATTAAAFLPGVSSASRAGTPLLSLQRQPLAGSLRAAAQGSSASSGQVVMESKVKAKKKKGSGAGNLPGAIDAEIREAQDYLAIDEQVRVRRALFSCAILYYCHRNLTDLARQMRYYFVILDSDFVLWG
jgi:complement component 1 Q subcomponent-binding protein